MSKYKFNIAFFAAALLVLFSCNSPKTEEESEEEHLGENIVELRDDQIKMAGIETGSVQLQSLSGLLKVNGNVTVAPQNIATVCIPLGGFVKNTSCMPGNSVTKGQTLAVIENQEFIDLQQNYLETKNKLAYAEAEYKRHSELYKDDVYSQKNLQQVSTEYNNLRAQMKGYEQKLEMVGIHPANLKVDNISRSVSLVSPISGVVKSVNVSIGKYVSTTDVLFEIINTDHLLLELTLFEKDADKVQKGQKIHFMINNESEQHEAVVYQAAKSISEDNTYKVYATVSSLCKNIMPGMYVKADIETSTNELTALPDEAIVNFDDKDYIFVVERNKIENGKPFTEYKMVEIVKGVSNNKMTEVKLPLNFDINSTKVVLKGAYNLLSAMKNAGEMSC